MSHVWLRDARRFEYQTFADQLARISSMMIAAPVSAVGSVSCATSLVLTTVVFASPMRMNPAHACAGNP